MSTFAMAHPYCFTIIVLAVIVAATIILDNF
jgi:hypothetical protein